MALTIGTAHSQIVALLIPFFFFYSNMNLQLSFQLIIIVSPLPLLFSKDVKYANSKSFGYGDKPNIKY